MKHYLEPLTTCISLSGERLMQDMGYSTMSVDGGASEYDARVPMRGANYSL